MSLTTTDLDDIRNIVESALIKQNSEIVKPLQGELESLVNDVKEIYEMLARLEKNSMNQKSFQKLSLEEKLLNLHSDLIVAAKQAGIKLPSH
ncbi:MAG: hypothetical protein M1554_01905 [Patescibacteria group bacterium]|jgi:KaiC/GvpD/RAD55 family RecA-like ATPase|nr:hypothetical protein [Patescibacteria group bacterium]